MRGLRPAVNDGGLDGGIACASRTACTAGEACITWCPEDDWGVKYLMKRLLLPLLAVLAMPSASHAKWMEASSDHFVIYADDTPSELQQFSLQLERFHGAMAFLLRTGNAVPSPSNRVTVFVVKNDRAVRKLAGDGAQFVYAFYQPRAGGSLAIVPAIDATSSSPSFSMIALLHEYAHHFQLSAARFPWPRWFVEGSAEFFASARFERDGAVMLGMAAQHRAGELSYAADVTATQLLDPESYEKQERRGYDAYYGRAWLLYHYLTFGKDRQGQFDQYLKRMQEGQSSADAARSTFGDLAKLDSDMDKYLRQRTITAARVPPTWLQPGPVHLRELSAGEAEMMPIRVRSRRGVTRQQALALLPEARAIAARHPQDASVLTALAEAEHDAGNDDQAIAAADAALALDLRQVNAYVQKGYALFRKAEAATDKAQAYRAARAPFLALNKIENDHPLPLVYYYLAFGKQGLRPSEMAVKALDRAVELAPFDLGLRFMLAWQAISDEQADKAIANLTPLAYNPHGGQSAEMARKLLNRVKSGEPLNSLDPAALSAEIEAAQDEPKGEPEGKAKEKANGGK
jgi:tetratricopeptide (TPR) repeat protein